MRTLSGKYRRKLRAKSARRRVALCRTLTYSDGMSTRSLRTANYSDEARARLGEAISAARRAAGFKWRTTFVRRHQDISVSSLAAVELSKPLVGVAVLEAIGTALGEHFPGR